MPKKVKKGAGGRSGGRTEEEKLLQLQQRAQSEREMEKKKEEILTLFLKDKLQKEERNAAVNLLKLNDGWRAILRQTRSAELHDDIVVLRQTFERQLDGMDSIIKSLACDLQEAERQLARVWRVHLQHVERLRTLQDKRLMFLQQQWERGLQQISSRFIWERKQMLTDAQQQRAVLQDSVFTLEQQHNNVMSDIRRLYTESVAANQSAHLEKMATLVQEEAEKLTEKTRQNQEVRQQYSSESKRAELLVSRNQHLVEMTNADVKKVTQLQNGVIDLRAKLNSIATENASVAGDLTAATQEMNQKTQKLRDQLTRAQVAARKQLNVLTVHSGAAAKKLRNVIATGERVLQVAELCWRLESEIDTFLPPSSSSPSSCADEDGQERPATEELTKMLKFPALTRRYSTALLHREALKKHEEALRRENQQLTLLLHHHLDAMTVSGLLTVNRAPTTTAPAATGRHNTVIEAVHAIKHSL